MSAFLVLSRKFRYDQQIINDVTIIRVCDRFMGLYNTRACTFLFVTLIHFMITENVFYFFTMYPTLQLILHYLIVEIIQQGQWLLRRIDMMRNYFIPFETEELFNRIFTKDVRVLESDSVISSRGGGLVRTEHVSGMYLCFILRNR